MEEIKFIQIQIDDLKRSLYAFTKMGDKYISITPSRILMTKRMIKKYENVKQHLEVLETLLDNCENRFLSVLHECLIRGTPIHPEDIQRLSGYINKILTIKKQWLEVDENAK